MGSVGFWNAVLAGALVSAVAFELRRDTVPQWRLFVPPLLALAVLLGLPALPMRPLEIAICAVVGLSTGAARAHLVRLRADHVWKLVRLGPLYDGVALALVLAVASGADIEPVRRTMLPLVDVLLLGGVFAASYLSGRAVALGLVSRAAAHDDIPPNGP